MSRSENVQSSSLYLSNIAPNHCVALLNICNSPSSHSLALLHPFHSYVFPTVSGDLAKIKISIAEGVLTMGIGVFRFGKQKDAHACMRLLSVYRVREVEGECTLCR